MTPIVEEYSFLLIIELPNINKVFWKKVAKMRFRKKLAQMINIEVGVVDQTIKKKGNIECFPWDFFKRYIAKNADDDRVMDVFALVIYSIDNLSKGTRACGGRSG